MVYLPPLLAAIEGRGAWPFLRGLQVSVENTESAPAGAGQVISPLATYRGVGAADR